MILKISAALQKSYFLDLFPKQKKSPAEKSARERVVDLKDSNLERLNQNQMCYHYTLGQFQIYRKIQT